MTDTNNWEIVPRPAHEPQTPTPSEHDVLMTRILLEPECDDHRLVMADWLDENEGPVTCVRCNDGMELVRSEERGGLIGGSYAPCSPCSGTGSVSNGFAARAEFIRVQCELAKLPNCGRCGACAPMHSRINKLCPASEYHPLRRRERELLERFWYEWSGIITVRNPGGPATYCANYHAGSDGFGITFSRGFPHSIRCTAADWIRIAPEIAWGPVKCERCKVPYVGTSSGKIVKGLEFSEDGGDYARVEDCPACSGRGVTGPTMVCPASVNPKVSWTYSEVAGRYVELPAHESHKRAGCCRCSGSGRVPRPMPITAQPIHEVRLTDGPVIHQSGGNDTYYVGNLGMFPQKYWRSLEGHRSRQSAVNAFLIALAAEWPWLHFSLPAAGQAEARPLLVSDIRG